MLPCTFTERCVSKTQAGVNQTYILEILNNRTILWKVVVPQLLPQEAPLMIAEKRERFEGFSLAPCHIA